MSKQKFIYLIHGSHNMVKKKISQKFKIVLI